jgi:hypothetical protein
MTEYELPTEKELETYLRRYLPTARDAYAHARDLEHYEKVMLKSASQLWNLPVDRLAIALENGVYDQSVSHHFLTMTPAILRATSLLNFPSTHLMDIFEAQIALKHENAAAFLYSVFTKVPSLCGPAGTILDREMSTVLANGGVWMIQKMSKSPKRGLVNQVYDIPTRSTPEEYLSLGRGGHSFSVEPFPPAENPSHTTIPSHYWPPRPDEELSTGLYIPLNPNQATFDAVFYEQGSKRATIFQVTVSERHSVNESGLQDLWNLAVDEVQYVAITGFVDKLNIPFPHKWEDRKRRNIVTTRGLRISNIFLFASCSHSNCSHCTLRMALHNKCLWTLHLLWKHGLAI